MCEKRIKGEVNRRRGRCPCLRCLCTNNYPEQIHPQQHETPRRRSGKYLRTEKRKTKSVILMHRSTARTRACAYVKREHVGVYCFILISGVFPPSSSCVVRKSILPHLLNMEQQLQRGSAERIKKREEKKTPRSALQLQSAKDSRTWPFRTTGCTSTWQHFQNALLLLERERERGRAPPRSSPEP